MARRLLITGHISIMVSCWQQGADFREEDAHCQHGSLEIQKDYQLTLHPSSNLISPWITAKDAMVTTAQRHMSHFLREAETSFSKMTRILPVSQENKDSGGSVVMKMPHWSLSTLLLVILVLSYCSLPFPVNIVSLQITILTDTFPPKFKKLG